MSSKPKILVFSGSSREGSLNQKLAAYCGKLLSDLGAEVTVTKMSDYEMPLYNGDLEEREGIPKAAENFKQLMKSHDGFLVSSPEYNSSITPLLKNTIDWVSRSSEGEASLVAFRGKSAALVSASPGALGGLRALVHLRDILGNIGVTVLPDQVALPKAHEAFEENGELTDEGAKKRLASLTENFFSLVSKLS